MIIVLLPVARVGQVPFAVGSIDGVLPPLTTPEPLLLPPEPPSEPAPELPPEPPLDPTLPEPPEPIDLPLDPETAEPLEPEPLGARSR